MLQSAVAARPAGSPPAHILQVRWTAAGFWYESETGVHVQQGDLTYTNTGRAGFDIVWQKKIFKQPDGHWLEYPFDQAKVLDASATVTQQANLPGFSCSAKFALDESPVIGTNKTVPRIWDVGSSFTSLQVESPAINDYWHPPTGVSPSSACGSFRHYYTGPVCWNNFTSCARVKVEPVLPVPPYSANDNNPVTRGGGVHLITDARNPGVTKSYTWDLSGANTSPPATPDTVHSLWFGCVSVQIDPKEQPKPRDPFLLGGFQPPSAGANPGAPPATACSTRPTCPGPVEILEGGIPVKQTMEAVIGERIDLRMRCAKTNEAPAQPRWTVAGATSDVQTTSALSSYTIGDAGAKAEPVTNLDSATLTFHFMRPGAFKVRAISSSGSYTTTFEVEAPKLGAGPYATTCRVDLTSKILPFAPQITEHVGPGWNDSCGGGPSDPLGKGRPGIAWRFPVRATSPRQAGRVGLVQLITVAAHHDNTLCSGLAAANQADVAAFYDSESANRGRAFVSLAPGATAVWQDRDSPFLGLALRAAKPPLASTIWDETFSAQDYLMFKPSKPGSTWAPLGRMDWGWAAVASLSGVGQPWQLVSHRDPKQFPVLSGNDDVPEFSGSVSPNSLAPGC